MAYRDEVLADNPVFYLPMDEGTGATTLNDLGSNNLDATLTGTYTWTTGPSIAGEVNNAVKFDGGRGTIGDNAALDVGGTFSIEYWFRTVGSMTSFGGICGRGTGNDSQVLQVRLSSGATNMAGFINGGSNQTLGVGLSWNDGDWHHLVFTGGGTGGGRVKWYVDGLKVQDVAQTQNSSDSTAPWLIGETFTTNTNIVMAHHALYTNELSAARVTAHYMASSASIPAYLEAVLPDAPINIWLLNEASGTVANGHVASNATYSGSGITYQVSGPGPGLNYGIATDGIAGEVTLPSLTLGAAQAQSWEIWAQNSSEITQSSSSTFLIGSTSDASAPMAFGDSTGALTDEVATIMNTAAGTDDRTGFTGFTISAGWHHHVMTYSGTQNGWIYYLDGVAVGSLISASGGSLGFTSLTFKLSRTNPTPLFRSWAGIAAAAVYNYTLTPTQVENHFIAMTFGSIEDDVGITDNTSSEVGIVTSDVVGILDGASYFLKGLLNPESFRSGIHLKNGGSLFRPVINHGNGSTAKTLNMLTEHSHFITLNSASCAITLAGIIQNTECTIDVYYKQDATGSRVITHTNTILWPDATPPTLTTTPNRTDIIRYVTIDGGTTIFGFVIAQNLG